MVKYPLYCLLVFGLLSGCASGIVDNEPTPPGTAEEYFWSGTNSSIRYERFDTLTGKRQLYDLEFNVELVQGAKTTYVIDRLGTGETQFSYRMTDRGILLENIGKNSIIPLPEGFTLVSGDSTTVAAAVAREMKRVVVTSPVSLFAIDKQDSIFYSMDTGRTWTLSSEWSGGTITALSTVNGGNTVTLYVGTAEGGIYKTSNSGRSWVPVIKPLHAEITALTITDTFLFFAANGRVFRYGGDDDTLDISNGQFVGTVTQLATVHSAQDSEWIIAGLNGGGIYRSLIPDEDSNYFYWQQTNTGQRIDKCLGLVPVSGKYLYALGESNGNVALYSSSDQGMNWTKATSDALGGATGLAYDGKSKLLVFGRERSIINVYTATGLTASLLRSPSLSAERVNDASALNGIFSAATTQGIYYSITSGEAWSNISASKLTQPGTKKVPLPGGLLVLRSGADALIPDSGWVAGQCEGMVLGKMTALTIRATVLPSLTRLDLTSFGSGIYEEVIPVRYNISTVNNLSLDVHLMIYFAKGKGPVWIRQVTGKLAVAEIYRLQD